MHATPGLHGRQGLLVGINVYRHFGEQQQLTGCVNDVGAMTEVLRERFGFPPGALTVLQNEQGTREGILGALAGLEHQTGPGDVVVFYYSGHGSRVRAPHRPSGWARSIVPHDSGRTPCENRDITDEEIHARVLELHRKTPYITLIFDSCFSGGLLNLRLVRARSGERAKIRTVEADPRPREPLAAFRFGRRDSGFSGEGPSGWPSPGERYVLLAGCRMDQYSFELKEHTDAARAHGALTYYLCKQLEKKARPDRTRQDVTYRDVFEPVAIRVRRATASYGLQQPQLEGARDRELFGSGSLPGRQFVPVVERSRNRVVLGAGAAHGLAAGSRWDVYPSGTRRSGRSTPRAGLVEVREVGSVTAEAEITLEVGHRALGAGCRAFEHAPAQKDRWGVRVEGDAGEVRRLRALRQRLADSRLLRPAADGEPAGARVVLLPARHEVQTADPVPHAGPLEEATWVVLGEEGEILAPLHPAGEPEGLAWLLEDLETWARYRRLLRLENRDPRSRVGARVRVELLRCPPGGKWQAAGGADGAPPVFDEGDRIGLEVRHEHEAPLFVSLLDFGLTGRITLLYPPPGALQVLLPGRTLDLGIPAWEPIELFLPGGFPFAAPPAGSGISGREHFMLVVTTREADFQLLEQEGCPTPEQRRTSPPLPDRGSATPLRPRDAPPVPTREEDDWAAVTIPFVLRRQPGNPLV
jgi:hypothetical protein